MLKQTVLAGLTCTLILGTMAMQPADSAGASATLTHVLGIVQTRTTAGWRGAAVSQRLFPGMTLRTGDKSRSQIRYDDGSVVRLGSRTLLRISQARDLRLLRGKTWVQKQPSSQQFRVRTPVAQATVLGTELFVSHNDANVSHVTTLDGHVEVQGELGDTQMVNPGEWVEIEPGKPVVAPTKFDWNELKKNERFLLDMDFVPAPDEDVDSEDWK
ncbi:MAG: FecR domain-containing protein [Candidatus Sericytochromatia bacterium]